MEIVVCIKQVPDTRDVAVDEKTGVLLRDGVDSVMNPYDLYALEAALRLKETYGGRVSVLSMGPPQAATVIREAYMMGADRGCLLCDRTFAGADTLATAFALSRAIAKLGEFDLIVCGLQTTDGGTAQVGPEIAEILGIPHESNVLEIREADRNSLQVVRDGGDSVETMRIELPCLISVTKAIGEPRLLSYRLKLRSADLPVAVWTAADIGGVDGNIYGLKGSPTQVERIFAPEAMTEQELWRGTAVELGKRLATKLRELRFV
jgi:electron transfer flavoprotein beta subunit